MIITQLKPSTKVKGRYLVHLDEGTILRVGEQELVDYGLYQGRELSLAEAEALEQSGQLSVLKQKAYDAIARRPLSRHDLEKKLRTWEATEEEIALLCDRFEELSLIDDLNYGKMLVRHQHQKGYGQKKIQQELYAHGISRELWEEVLAEVEEDGTQEAILRFLEQKFRSLNGATPDQKQIKKVSDALARRGFSWGEIRAGLLQYTQELEDFDC